jgi:hypothetical protein
MDGRRFDDITKALGTGTSRRAVLERVVGVAVAGLLGLVARPTRAQEANDACASFCGNLPPGRGRGQCVSECAKGGGLYAACGGDPDRLCLATDDTATCCASGRPCLNGVCGCESGYEFCRKTQLCEFDNCRHNQQGRLIFNPETCRCDCKPEFVKNVCGYCMVPCEPGGDECPSGTCGVSADDGQGVCIVGSWAVHCSPPNATCTSTADCCRCGINNVCMPDGFCRAPI